MPGTVYTLSVRRTPDPGAVRREAYAHVGLDQQGVDLPDVNLAESFHDAGLRTADLIAFIEAVYSLIADRRSRGGRCQKVDMPRTSDSEDRPTDLYLCDDADLSRPHWLAITETVHETWPRLLDILGISVTGMILDDAGIARQFSVPGRRVPRALRLKSGWDYDAEGNQVHLPIEEAWRRFEEWNLARAEDRRLDTKTMVRMRRHMKAGYRRRAKAA